MNTMIFPTWSPETGAFRTISVKATKPVGLVVAALLILFVWSGPLLRLIDPLAAAPDIGVLGLVLLGLLSGLAFIAISHWLLGLMWPVFRDFRNYHFEPIFKSLLPWQKIIIYLACYFLLLYAFVACLAAVF